MFCSVVYDHRMVIEQKQNVAERCRHKVTITLRPDQFSLLLLGYCEVKIGPSDRKKKQSIGVWLQATI